MRRLSFPKVPITLAILLLLLTACATLPTQPLKPLEVTPVDLHLSGGGLFAQNVNLTLKVENPNPFPLAIEGVETGLWVNEQPLATGVTQVEVQLPQYGQQIVKVEATVRTLALLRGIARLGFEKPLTYRLRGQLRIKRSFLPAVSIPFEAKGRLDFWNFFNRQAIPLPLQE